MLNTDVAIIGGGPAGMSAAVSAAEAGAKTLILERESSLGGILKQCIHTGFGLHRFGDELTGPEYANRYINEVSALGIPTELDTTVLSISKDRVITAISPKLGIHEIQAKAIVLAMGCRERPRGALTIPGTRPAGIYTAGTAQKFVNIKGYMPGKSVVILGSGDIGLIMARRMTLEGAKVHAVCEIMPYSGGLPRNIEQCLNDFDIPLKLSHTVTEIHGKERLTGVTIAKVDSSMRPIPGTEEYIACDTLLLSVGLIPENELTKCAGIALDKMTNGAVTDQFRETEVSGIFAAGNVLHVHDLADYASKEAEIAGSSAALFAKNMLKHSCSIALTPGEGVRYTVPQKITCAADTSVYFRVSRVFRSARVNVISDGKVIKSEKRVATAPGTMDEIKLSAAVLKQAENGLTIEMEEDK